MNIVNGHNKSSLTWLGILLIVFTGTILYSQILNAPFVFDDYNSIVENESIRSVSKAIANTAHNRYLTSLSFALNYAAGGLKPFGYHLINNLIHITNSLLVCYLVFLTFRTPMMVNSKLSAHFIAFTAAFIFVVHPVQIQAVTYVVQRATIMATMFYLISLVMYAKARLSTVGKETMRNAVNSRFVFFYLISTVAAILAMKSKEIAFTLPLAAILYEVSFFNRTEKQSWKRFSYLIPIMFTTLIIPLSLLNFKGPIEAIAQDINVSSRETINISRIDYLLTQFRVIVTYLRLMIFPVNQNLDYSHPVYHSFFSPQVFLSFSCLAMILCLGIYLFPRLRLASFGIFWFFIALSVESSIIPIRDVIVEHRLYLPSIGFFISTAVLADHFLPNAKTKVSLLVLVIVLLSAAAYTRNTAWKSPQTLWEDVIEKSPNNARAYNNLGVYFKNEGDYERAIKQFENSLKADRNYSAVYFNLGDIQYKLGNYENAIAFLNHGLSGNPDVQLHLDMLNKLGRAYSAQGQTEKAIQTFQEAIKVLPTAVAPYNNLAIQYVKIGEYDMAIEILEKALKFSNEQYLHSNLSIAYGEKMEMKNTQKTE